MSYRNRILEAKRRAGDPLPASQVAIAAMLLEGESRAKRIAAATGYSPRTVENEMQVMRARYGVETTVALALALYREAMQ